MPEPLSTADTSHSHYHSELFTVRLWCEELGEGRVKWRGKVQHVLSGETRYFRDWATLIAALQEMPTTSKV